MRHSEQSIQIVLEYLRFAVECIISARSCLQLRTISEIQVVCDEHLCSRDLESPSTNLEPGTWRTLGIWTTEYRGQKSEMWSASVDIAMQTISQGCINSIVDSAVFRTFPFRGDLRIDVSVGNTAFKQMRNLCLT